MAKDFVLKVSLGLLGPIFVVMVFVAAKIETLEKRIRSEVRRSAWVSRLYRNGVYIFELRAMKLGVVVCGR